MICPGVRPVLERYENNKTSEVMHIIHREAYAYVEDSIQGHDDCANLSWRAVARNSYLSVVGVNLQNTSTAASTLLGLPDPFAQKHWKRSDCIPGTKSQYSVLQAAINCIRNEFEGGPQYLVLHPSMFPSVFVAGLYHKAYPHSGLRTDI